MMKRENDQFEWKEAEFLMDLSLDAFKTKFIQGSVELISNYESIRF